MPFVEKRLSGPTQLTTSAQSIYTVPAGGQSAVIRQLVVTNVSASAATFTFYVGTESASNALFSNSSVAANDTVIINLSQVLATNEVVRAKASVNSALNLTMSGVTNDGPIAQGATYIADGAITTSKIATGAVVTEDLASNAVTQSKLASNLSGVTVTTSALRSTAVPTPFAGQTIFETDTNRMLLWNGTAWVIPNAPAQNPTGLELIRTTNFSGTTSLTMDNTLSSTYDVYRILIFVPSIASGGLYFRLRNNSADIDGTAYYTAGYGVAYNGGLATSNQSGATFYAPMPGNMYDGASMSMDLFYRNNGSITAWNSHGHTRGNAVSYSTAGGYHASTTHNGFRFYTDASATAQISVYGYRK